jgi:hypothetical protein
LAAVRLANIAAGISAVSPLLKAWLAEKDACTNFQMTLALTSLLTSQAEDPGQRPGGQEWISPFKACVESERPAVRLVVEPQAGDGTILEIYAENTTDRTLPFLAASPQRLYSASVFDPNGGRAKIAKEREEMYKPYFISFSSPLVLALPPHEVTHIWTWRVGEDFDMSAPGTYRVSLGGRIGFLDATICSNVVEVRVAM